MCVCVHNTNVSLGYNHKLITRRIYIIDVCVCLYWFVVPQTSCTSVRLSPLSARHLLAPPPHPSERRNALCLPLAHLVYLICLLPCALCGRWPIEFRVFFCCGSTPGGRGRCLGSTTARRRCYLRDTFWYFWLLAWLPIKMTFAIGPKDFPFLLRTFPTNSIKVEEDIREPLRQQWTGPGLDWAVDTL